MNANTRLRLWKETRALLPMWAAMAALIAIPFLLRWEHPMEFAIPAYWLGCALLGPVCMGQEFQHRTMGLLLSQPVSRRRLWWEKMAALGAAMVGQFAWMELLWGTETGQMPGFAGSGEELLKVIHLLVLPWLIGFCTGPALTLLARSIIGGVAMTFLCPWFLTMFVLAVIPEIWISHSGVDVRSNSALISLGFYCGALFLFGCHRFGRMEDIQGRGTELTLPAALAKPFAEFTGRFTLGRSSALGHLVRKEVRLHLPAFVVALGLVAMWLALVVAVFARATMDKGFLMLPTVLLCLGIPVIAGIVAVAEERSLGVHDWHLTLPVSARRQWGVKVLVAFGVNVAFGILLPGLLAHASSWLANDPRLVAEIPGSKVPHFLVANAVIFCAALYASTASANPMRALIGAIVVFIAGVTVMGSALMTVDSVPDSLYPMPDRHGWWPAPELCQWAFESITPLGWGFLVWFGALGLANFRHSMEAGWRPLRRLVPFVATIWLVLVAVFTGLRMFSHYDWTYYEMSNSLRWDSQKRAKQRAAERQKMEAVPTTPVPLLNANPGKPPG